MYQFVDQPVSRLGMADRFTLWAMRAWVLLLAQGRCPPGSLAPAFGRMNVLTALPDFHMAMALLNRDGLEKLELAALNCATVSEHEAVLLGLWKEAAGGDRQRVSGTLDLLIAEEAVAIVTSALLLGAPKLALIDRSVEGLDQSIGGPL